MDIRGKIDLREYTEIDRITMSRDVTIILTSLGTILFFVSGSLFTFLFNIFSHTSSSTSNDSFSWPYLIIFVLLVSSTFIIHELIHGMFIKIYNGKPTYGAGVSHYILPYFYTTTETLFQRNTFIVIALAPLFILSGILIIISIIVPFLGQWLLLPCILNASGAIGDIWMVCMLLKLPKSILIKDDKTGTTIYSKDKQLAFIQKTRKENKTLRNFSLGFGSTFLILLVIIMLLPTVLEILQINQFTLGIKDSFFIAQYILNPKFNVEISFLPLIPFCIFIGIMYSLLKKQFNELK